LVSQRSVFAESDFALEINQEMSPFGRVSYEVMAQVGYHQFANARALPASQQEVSDLVDCQRWLHAGRGHEERGARDGRLA
jgi:hypothetical protein